MENLRYQISEASKLTQIQAHVLRYWEEELQLPIGRNEMGHRYYTEKDIRTFLSIKELKKKGLQLRVIRDMLHEQEKQPSKIMEIPKQKVAVPKQDASQTREEKFGEIIKRLAQEIKKSEKKEGRYRRVDEAIRRHQESRKMVAESDEMSNRRKKSKKIKCSI